MKLVHLSTRTIYGGILGIGLAFVLAEFSSRGMYEIYSSSTLFRSITGNSPNALADGLLKVSWALIFCCAWWMLWSFDKYFCPKPISSSDSNEGTEKNMPSSSKSKMSYDSKPSEEQSETKEKKVDAPYENTKTETKENQEDESSPMIAFDEQDEKYFKILEISDDELRDLELIKSVYRKKIAQYHPDKVAAMGPEIRQVAEQKAKEINEAYEHFRKKFS